MTNINESSLFITIILEIYSFTPSLFHYSPYTVSCNCKHIMLIKEQQDKFCKTSSTIDIEYVGTTSLCK